MFHCVFFKIINVQNPHDSVPHCVRLVQSAEGVWSMYGDTLPALAHMSHYRAF